MKRIGPIKTLKNILILSRPKQWIKSLLIIVPPIISSELINWSYHNLVAFLNVFIIFVVASISIYLLNDWIDIDKDKLHPIKKKRPLAGSEISKTSVAVYFVCIISTFILLFIKSPQNLKLILTCYLTINFFYTLFLKHIAYWEMFAVSSGFVLRALAGATLVAKEPSREFYVIIFFGSLLIVAAKRLAELQHETHIHRRVLSSYTARGLENVISLTTFVIIATYCLFLFSAFFSTQSLPSIVILYFSALPFLVIMFLLQELAQNGQLEAPEIQMITNKGLLVNSLLWILFFVVHAWLEN